MCCVPWDIKIRSGRVSTGAGSARALEPGLCVHRVVQGGLPDASPDERPAGRCRAGGAAAVGRCPGPCADAAVVRRGPGRGLGGDLCQGGPDRRPLADLGAARPLRARGHRPRALVRALGRMVERTSPPWRRRSSGRQSARGSTSGWPARGSAGRARRERAPGSPGALPGGGVTPGLPLGRTGRYSRWHE